MRSLGMRTLIAAAMLAGLTTSASALVCGPHTIIVDTLAEKHGETRVASGVSSNGALVEVFASEDGSTWTVVVTGPTGMPCLVLDGEFWEQFDLPVSGSDA